MGAVAVGAGAEVGGAGDVGGGLPRIPREDVTVGPCLSTEGANGVVRSGVYRTRSVHGVEVAELALPVALKVGVGVRACVRVCLVPVLSPVYAYACVRMYVCVCVFMLDMCVLRMCVCAFCL